MLGLMGFSGSLPLYVIHRYYIFVFIDRANKDACLLAQVAGHSGWYHRQVFVQCTHYVPASVHEFCSQPDCLSDTDLTR